MIPTTNDVLSNKTTNIPSTNITLTINNSAVNNKAEVANAFNDFFINVGSYNLLPITIQPTVNIPLTT